MPHLVGSEMPEECRITLQYRQIIYRKTRSYTLFPAQTVQNVERVLGKIGVDTVIVVNLSHPDLGIPVVRVIIPQMIGYSGSSIKVSVFSNAIKHTI